MLLALVLACVPRIPEPPALIPAPPTPTAARAPKVCWLDFATGNLPHGVVVAHGALDADVASTQAGLLVVDPRGSWLVDGGMAGEAAAFAEEVPGFLGFVLRRTMKDWVVHATPAAALRGAGVEPAALAGTIITHAHYDHLGGVLDLDGAPVWMPQAEIDLVRAAAAGEDASVLPGDARRLGDRARPIPFASAPLYAWDQTWDVYGDGSLVVISTPGHSPGSVSVFVRLPDGRPVLMVGDTVWVREGYTERERKGWLVSALDADGDATAEQIARLWALHRAVPDLTILPAHDRRVWAEVFGQPGCLGG